MQAKNGSIIATVIICSIVLLAVIAFAGYSINSNIPEVPEINIPTAAEVAALVVIPEVDTSVADRICELTDGCNCWDSRAPYLWKNKVLDEEDDLEEALLDLIGLEDDEIDGGFDIDVKDYQAEDCISEDYTRDGNWKSEIFARVTYQDVDEDEDEHIYVLITSVFDEGEYEDLTVEEVTRRFEF